MAHLKRYGQHFNVNIEKMKNLKKIGLLAHPEVSLSRIVSPQKAVFKAFFFRKEGLIRTTMWCGLEIVRTTLWCGLEIVRTTSWCGLDIVRTTA